MATDGERVEEVKEHGAMDRAKRYIRAYGLPAIALFVIYFLASVYSVLEIINVLISYYNYYRDPSPDKQPPWKVKKRPIPPKCLDDPAYGTHTYVQLKKIKLHYVENGDKEKPLMLFLHGFPEFWFSWRHQIKEFSKDYWTVAVDMRGYGDSEKPPGVRYYKTRYLVEDIKNLIEALGRQKCILVAHDWGGVQTWNLVEKYPELIEKYVIISAPHRRFFRRALSSSLRQFKMSWYIFLYQMPYLPEFLLRHKDLQFLNRLFQNKKKPIATDDELEAYKFMFGKPGAFTCPVNYYRANFFSHSRYMKHKVDVSVKKPPGLNIYGENDFAIDSICVDLVKINLPDVKVNVIEGGHFIHEEEPEKVNSSIREFLTAN